MKTLWVSCLTISMFSGSLPAQSLSRYTRTNAAEAGIEIRAGETASYRVPRTIYGTFLEDIGESIFGGVSAQLVDNPSLESYDASLETLDGRFGQPEFKRSTAMGLPLPWLPLHDNGWRYEPRWGNAANSDRYLFLIGLPDREVGIRQSIYLPFERELDYQGVLFATCGEDITELTASFRVHDKADSVLASAPVPVPPGVGWTKLSFRLKLPRGVVKPLEPVDFVIALRGNHRVSLDEIRLYPADAVGGLDPEVIEFAKQLHSPLLRFGGNFTSGYHWRNGVGPRDRRPTKLNQAWGFPEFNEFGTDELMDFCRLIGARPQICLNLGSGTAEEARDWVDYCQGRANSKEGRLRAAHGHPEPYPVAAWEMGNELWGHFQLGWQSPEGHAQRYLVFYRAIHDVVPPETMIFATGGDVDFFRGWNEALIRDAGPELHYLTTHFVVGMEDMVNRGADRDTIWAADFAVPVGVARALESVRAQIEASPATRGRVRVAFTEWLFAAPDGSSLPRWDNLGGALIAAGWMNMLLNDADFVPVSDMTGLMEFGGIYKRRGRVYVTPQYWAFSLYSNHAGDTVVATDTRVRHYDVREGLRRLGEIPDVPFLDVVATRDSKSGNLVLFVVNRDWKNSIPTLVHLRDFNPSPQAEAISLRADSILAMNDEEHPDAVKPMSSKLDVPGPEFRYVFPSQSLTVLTFKPR